MYCMFQHEKCKVYMKYTFLSIQVVKYFCSEYQKKWTNTVYVF